MAATKKGSGGDRPSTSDTKTARPKLRSSHTASPGHEGRPRPAAKPGAKARAKTPIVPREREPKGGPPRSKRGAASGRPAAAGPSVASDAARELAVTIAITALDKKAIGLEVLDVSGRVDYADFLVLMTGRSDRQVASLAQSIEEALRKKGVRATSVEGLPHASWVLMDFGDVVVHVFQEDSRNLYDLEGLWMDARRLPVPLPVAPS